MSDDEFGAIRTRVLGRAVSVLGSAPTMSAKLAVPNADVMVSVNVSALALGEGRVPDITVVNTAVAGVSGAGALVRHRLAELRTGLLVVVESGVPLAKALAVFEPIKRVEVVTLTLDQRCRFLEDALARPLTGRVGGDHVPSTGFFTCLLLLACGAARVRMAGFSFRDGHSYLSQELPRQHIERDRDVLRLIQQRGSPVEFPPELTGRPEETAARGSPLAPSAAPASDGQCDKAEAS